MDRYGRQTILPWFGRDGQERLRRSSVVVVGCGGTGCACSSYLVRAGVGSLHIVDGDVVCLSDLHRQVLFMEEDAVGSRLKARVAAERLRQANQEVEVTPVVSQFDPDTAVALVRDADLIVDCSDNVETRMLLNEVCAKYSKAWIHGACVSSIGIVIPFPISRSACYKCVVPSLCRSEPSQTCRMPGILGSLAGTIGSLEATEAIKMLVSPEDTCQRIIYLDGLSCRCELIDVKPKPDCPVCIQGRYDFLEGRSRWSRYRVCGSDTVHIKLQTKIDLVRLRGRLPDSHRVRDIDGALKIEAGDNIVIVFGDGRAVVKGTSEIDKAQDVVDRLLES